VEFEVNEEKDAVIFPQEDYRCPPFESLEGIHTWEYLVSYLFLRYPDRWQDLVKGYSFYGISVEPNKHLFKYKGGEIDPDERDRYVEIPFSDLYKSNTNEACKLMNEHEWAAIIEKKIAEKSHPYWAYCKANGLI